MDARRSRLAAAVLFLGGLAGASAHGEGPLTWSNAYVDCGQGSNLFCSWGADPQGWDGRSLARDASVTGVHISATGVPKGAYVETCLYVSRAEDPVYPGLIGGYSELMCWHATAGGAARNWTVDLDLGATPLYLPANTRVGCNSNLGPAGVAPTAEVASGARLHCDVRWSGYEPGAPRYRMLRLPYVDMGTPAGGSMAASYYIGSAIAPLHVAGVALFQSFGGDDSDASLSGACLRWLRQGGAVVEEACFPDQRVSPGRRYTTPAFRKVDWTIPAPDLLTAAARQSRNNTDAAFYALVEIPPGIAAGPENIVRDYGNVPANYLPGFCAEHLDALEGLARSKGVCEGPSCDAQSLIDYCVRLFPPATCSDAACRPAVQTTPPPSGTGAAPPPPPVTRDEPPSAGGFAGEEGGPILVDGSCLPLVDNRAVLPMAERMAVDHAIEECAERRAFGVAPR